jgi:predicted Zn-dependent protease
MAGQFIGMGYTRKDEAQADELGFDFYSRAGWDPYRFGDFFQHMIDKGYDKTPEMERPPQPGQRVNRKQRITPAKLEWHRQCGSASSETQQRYRSRKTCDDKSPEARRCSLRQLLHTTEQPTGRPRNEVGVSEQQKKKSRSNRSLIERLMPTQILGQERALASLAAALRSGRFHHAWILAGPRRGKDRRPCTSRVLLDPEIAAQV